MILVFIIEEDRFIAAIVEGYMLLVFPIGEDGLTVVFTIGVEVEA